MDAQIRRIELTETTKPEWLAFLRQTIKAGLMPSADKAAEHPESDGLYRSMKDILSLSEGSAVYRLRKPTSPDEARFLTEQTVLGYTNLPVVDAAFMGVDTGSIQVLTDLNNPEDHTYVRQFSRQLQDFTPWQEWTPGTKAYRIPKTLSELEQQLRI